MILLLTACTDSPVTAYNTASIEENLETLEGLQVFEVGGLINEALVEAGNCYGGCPGMEDEVAAEEARQAARLDALVRVAIAEPSAAADACDDAVIAANLDTLADLAIIEVGAFLEAVPENNPNCYNLPCEADIQAADALTCERAERLDHTVRNTRGI